MKPHRWTPLVLLASSTFAACSDGGAAGPSDPSTTTTTTTTSSTTSTTPTPTTLAGALQKGPFILGSTIDVRVVDAQGNPTGESYSTTTLDDRGEFSVLLPGQEPVSIEGNGYYWDEVRERVSSAPITLRAWYDPAADVGAPAFVNLVTHLSYLRVKTLLGDATADPPHTLQSAVAQAEQELVSELGLGPAGLTLGPGTGLDLGGSDTLGDAYVLALALVVLDAAQLQAGAGADPEGFVQQLLNQIESDLAPDGKLDQLPTELFANAERDVNVPRAKVQIAKRLAALDPTRDWVADPPPDIDRILDSDRDEVVNIDDNCVRVASTEQADADGDGVGDACDHHFQALAMGHVSIASCGGLCTNMCGIHAAGSSRPEGQVSCWHPENGVPSPWHEFDGFLDLDDVLDGPAFRAVSEVSVSQQRCVVFADDRQLFCWGGFGSPPPGGTNWAELQAGTCAVRVTALNQTGPFTCWGAGDFSPPVSESSSLFGMALPHGTTVCTLDSAGALQCWNMLAAPGSRLLPSDASVDPSARFSDIFYGPGATHFCGLTRTTGDVLCWRTSTDVNTWSVHWPGAALAEYAGGLFDCGLTQADGAVVCRSWPTSPTATLPVPARPGFGSLVAGAIRYASGGIEWTGLACALDGDGRIECFTADDKPLEWR